MSILFKSIDLSNFFKIGQKEGLKQYSPSKEHKPNPIIHMRLFMDGDGIPLAFNINKGNTNESGGYIPTYTRTDFTDDIHEAFGFRTDYEIVNTKEDKYS